MYLIPQGLNINPPTSCEPLSADTRIFRGVVIATSGPIPASFQTLTLYVHLVSKELFLFDIQHLCRLPDYGGVSVSLIFRLR